MSTVKYEDYDAVVQSLETGRASFRVTASGPGMAATKVVTFWSSCFGVPCPAYPSVQRVAQPGEA